MAVRIIYGAPRSGKSYYAVRHLVKEYFNEGSDGLFTLQDKFKNLVIFTNIDNLKVPHKNLDEVIRQVGSVEQFFSYDYQEKIYHKYPQVVYFIDEAQMKFPDNFRDHKVFNWFQYHGHWGQDIYLMTQDRSLLPRQITALSEITIKALPRSTSLLGGRDLRYNVMLGSGYEVGDKIILPKRQKYFDLYRSQNSSESQKVRNPLIKYGVILGVVALFAFWNFSRMMNRLNPTSALKSSPVVPSSSTPSSPVSSSTFSSFTSRSSAPPPEEFVPYKLSYILQDYSLFIVFDNILIPAEQFPYSISRGAYNTLYALIPSSVRDRLQGTQNQNHDNFYDDSIL